MGLDNQAGVGGGILGALTSAVTFIWSTLAMFLVALGITLGYIREPSSVALRIAACASSSRPSSCGVPPTASSGGFSLRGFSS